MGSGRVLAVLNLDSKLLDLANMKYVFLPWPYDPGPRFRKILSPESMTVYENTAALPRAYVVSRALKAADEDEALRLLEAKDFVPRTMVVLQAAEVPRTGEGGGSVSWTSRDSDRFELAVETSSDSILVVSDTDYPGWEADVDGVSTPILRANLAFRAVALTAGKHQVRMRFRPASARTGLLVSLLSIAGLLAGCARRKKSPSPKDGDILQV